MSTDSSIGKPGPFEVKLHNSVATPRRLPALDAGNSVPELGIDDEPAGPMAEPPRRRYECAYYETCLDLAAALNWHSFTCRGCSGSVDQTLMWRARQKARKDSVAKALCDLPPIVAHRAATAGAATSGTRTDDVCTDEPAHERREDFTSPKEPRE